MNSSISRELLQVFISGVCWNKYLELPSWSAITILHPSVAIWMYWNWWISCFMKCDILTCQCSSVKDHKKQILKGPCFLGIFFNAVLEHCLKEEIYLKYFSFINPFFKDVKYLTESSVEGGNLVKEIDINEVFLLLLLCQYSELKVWMQCFLCNTSCSAPQPCCEEFK